MQGNDAECFIYKVHRHLRNVNDKAYEPEIIAIGPYHRGKTNLIMMEKHKHRYFEQILQRGKERANFFSNIKRLEEKARKCYAEPIDLDADELVEVLVMDGCFIIELLRKSSCEPLRERNDPIFTMDWILNSLKRDLILFENQIPLFVLSELYDLIEAANPHLRLNHLVTEFFKSMNPRIETQEIGDFQDIKHLLHLIYRNWYISSDLVAIQEAESTENKNESMDSATKLREANVKFESTEECSLQVSTENKIESMNLATKLREANVKFKLTEKCSLHEIRFASGTMELPPLVIEDRTETLLRNMIAYEQYFQENGQNPLTDYVMLLDWLIDSSSDVEILCQHKIIENLLGDSTVAAMVINKLTESVTGPRKIFIYEKVFKDVDLYCNRMRNRWMQKKNRWMAKLRHNYLNSPWAILSMVAGIILLLLTFVQTVCSVLQVLPKK